MQFKQPMLLMTTLSSTCTAQFDEYGISLIGQTCPDVGCGEGLICDEESTLCMKNDELDDNVVTEAPTDAPAEDTQEPDAMTMEPEKCTVKTDPPTQEPEVEPTDEPVEPTDEPVDGPVEPLEPTDEPVEPTDEPVDGPVEPLEPTDAPIDEGNDIATPPAYSTYRNLRSNN